MRKGRDLLKPFRQISGIQRRWIFNSLSLVIALVFLFEIVFCVSFAIYCYSNLRVGLEEKAKTTTDFFGNYISQSYNEYYQSCIRYAQTFEEKNHL